MAARALRGVGAAPGIAAGKVHQLDGAQIETPGAPVPPPGRAAELKRASGALEEAALEVERLSARLESEGRTEEAEILATGAMMARDPQLATGVAELILQRGLNAGTAIAEAIETHAAALAALDEPMLASRADDVRSLGRRAMRLAVGGVVDTVDLDSDDVIVIARELGPADVAELRPAVKGLALAGGGVTAHAAIVARSLGLPMVVGLGEDILAVPEGEALIVDGSSGVVEIRPGRDSLDRAGVASERRARAMDRAVAEKDLSTVTTDGHPVLVRGNASGAAEVAAALGWGADGIGLFRTELAFLDAAAWPTHEQHRQALAPAFALLRGSVATVRLLDFGGDKTPPFLEGTPLRGVQLLLEAPQALKAQLAAILEVAAGVQLRILVPMITEPAQLRAVRDVLQRCLAEVHAAGLAPPMPPLGAMVEVPAAATMAPEIAAVADFLSVGTNDLSQLQLGIERSASRRAAAHHPAVLRLVDMAVRAGHQRGISVSLCGESASDRLVMPLFVGLGVDELSVGASRVGAVRGWLRRLSYAAARDAATAALCASSLEEVDGVVEPLARLLEPV
jgi:phosphoenolpyruvate-protein phosphotransferase